MTKTTVYGRGRNENAGGMLRPPGFDDVHGMIQQLRVQFDKVKSDAAFLALKQTELRPGDEISMFGFMDAQEQVRIEQSLLAGHAWMIQQELFKRHSTPDAKTKQLLREIQRFGNGVFTHPKGLLTQTL